MFQFNLGQVGDVFGRPGASGGILGCLRGVLEASWGALEPQRSMTRAASEHGGGDAGSLRILRNFILIWLVFPYKKGGCEG